MTQNAAHIGVKCVQEGSEKYILVVVRSHNYYNSQQDKYTAGM